MNKQKLDSSGQLGIKAIIPTVIVALIVFAAIGFYLTQSNPAVTPVENRNVTAQPSSGSMTGSTSLMGQGMMEQHRYRNGLFKATGNYVSPGGPRTLEVTITLTDGVITGADTIGTATDATSKRFQGEFVSGFKEQVVGKNIDEVDLVKVAGSSLSPKGFNDALTQIKAEAQS